MTVKNAAGETLSKAQVEALRTTVTHEDTYTFDAPLYETFALPGEGDTHYESGTRKVIVPNQEYTQAQIDALFEAGLAEITSIDPDTGAAAGGDDVTITGTNFEGVTAVTFGGVDATNVVAVNSTTVTCTTPAHAAGAVDVVVVDDTGTSTLTGGFTYA